MLQYCVKCVAPTSRPNLTLDAAGVCTACRNAEAKVVIDWVARRARLEEIFDRHRRSSDHEYDCIVPVSGGKDSIYQTHIAKNVFNMNPLCVSFRPLSRTLRGEQNLQALRDMGVDHIDFAPNPLGVNKITRRSFERFGDCSLVDHLAIYNIPPNVALKFHIPLVLWGENPYMEYGGDAASSEMTQLGRKYSRDHHIIKGMDTQKWVDETLPLREINSMIYPDDAAMQALGYEPIFLGYYLPWDARENLKVAQSHGFLPREEGPLMGLYNYADLDCMNIIIHHYFKWLKFGFNRVTDHASNEIRKGRMTREHAIELIRTFEGVKPPREYILAFCDQIGISEARFWDIAEQFRNHDIWKINDQGEWYIEGWIAGDKLPDRFEHCPISDEEHNYLSFRRGRK